MKSLKKYNNFLNENSSENAELSKYSNIIFAGKPLTYWMGYADEYDGFTTQEEIEEEIELQDSHFQQAGEYKSVEVEIKKEIVALGLVFILLTGSFNPGIIGAYITQNSKG